MKHYLAMPLLVAGLAVPMLAGGRYVSVVPRGTQIQVSADNPITVARWDRGRIYSGRVVRDVFNRDGNVAIPRGSYAEMIVRREGPGELELDLESVTVNGRRYVMESSGPDFNMNQAAYNNGEGLVGSIVGAIANASGGHVEYRGNAIHVPDGSVMTFQLQQPLHVVSWGDGGYTDHGEHYHHFEDHGWYR
jgi:hypothetical protein